MEVNFTYLIWRYNLLLSSLTLSSARILYVRSAGEKIYLDVYTNIPGEYNDFIISAACLIGFSLQEPEEVDEAIPEGYSVKEFTL